MKTYQAFTISGNYTVEANNYAEAVQNFSKEYNIEEDKILVLAII